MIAKEAIRVTVNSASKRRSSVTFLLCNVIMQSTPFSSGSLFVLTESVPAQREACCFFLSRWLKASHEIVGCLAGDTQLIAIKRGAQKEIDTLKIGEAESILIL